MKMDAVSTCTRLRVADSNSHVCLSRNLLRVSERISRDCSSLECAGMDLHHTSEHAGRPTSFRRSVPYSVSNTYSATAHHALIDVPEINVGNILAQYAKPSDSINHHLHRTQESLALHLYFHVRYLR